jgi:hypothetical protein
LKRMPRCRVGQVRRPWRGHTPESAGALEGELQGTRRVNMTSVNIVGPGRAAMRQAVGAHFG